MFFFHILRQVTGTFELSENIFIIIYSVVITIWRLKTFTRVPTNLEQRRSEFRSPNWFNRGFKHLVSTPQYVSGNKTRPSINSEPGVSWYIRGVRRDKFNSKLWQWNNTTVGSGSVVKPVLSIIASRFWNYE